MAKYALTDEGLKVLKDRDFRKKLLPYQRDIFNQGVEKLKEEILNDPEKVKRKYSIEQQGRHRPQERRSHVVV